MNMKNAIGMLAGAALGFAYYKFIGCTSGGCPLTSNPWITVLVGLVFGAMVTSNSNRPGQTATQSESKES